MLRATLLAVLAGGCLQLGAARARPADPIPPVAPWLSDAEALALLPAAVRSRSTKQLVLDRSSRQLILLEQGQLRCVCLPLSAPKVGKPLGEHRVLFKTVNPVWRHPGTGALVPPGGRNPGVPLIAFYQDCSNPGGWDGEKVVQVRGCSHVGLHGTPHRWTVDGPCRMHAFVSMTNTSAGCLSLWRDSVVVLP